MSTIPLDRQGKVIPPQPSPSNPAASPFNLSTPPPATASSPRPSAPPSFAPGAQPYGAPPPQTQSLPTSYASAPSPYSPPPQTQSFNPQSYGAYNVYENKAAPPIGAPYGAPQGYPPGYGAPAPSYAVSYGQPPQPYAQPAQPYGQPAQPYGQPSQPYGQPAQPYGQPAQPYGQPAQPYGQPPYAPPPQAQGGSVSLVKGGNVSLSKAVPGLVQIRVGLGWDVRQTPGAPFDLDASAFLLKGDGRVRFAQDLIFYNNKQSSDGSVYHHGDNLTGVGEGDDEIISVDVRRVPPDIQKIVFVVSIYDAVARGQNFGQVSRAFIRVVDANTNQEICRFDLTEEASMINCMIFGEVYRYGGEWKFRAIGQGVQGGLRSCGQMFGVNMQ